jgi:hypothetical protein
MSIYDTCAASNGDDALKVVQCIANWIETEKYTSISGGNVTSESAYSTNVETHDFIQWLLVLTGALVFFMQAGFAMVCAGAIRKKNVNNTVSLYHWIPSANA